MGVKSVTNIMVIAIKITQPEGKTLNTLIKKQTPLCASNLETHQSSDAAQQVAVRNGSCLVAMLQGVASGAVRKLGALSTLLLLIGFQAAVVSPAVAQSASTVSTNQTLCLDLNWGDYVNRTNGGHVQIWGCNSQSNQNWRFNPSTSEITLDGTNLCLDVNGTHWNERKLGGIVWTYACHGGINQKWSISSSSGEVKSSNGQCLDVHYGDWINRNNGGKVQMWDCNGQGNQRWTYSFNNPADNTEMTQYDDLGRSACHNCYEPQFANSIDEVLNKISAIELDFYDEAFNSVGLPNGSMYRDWYVRHYRRGENDNNCGGTLSGCLSAVKRWSDNNRSADVITIYLDKKQNWSGSDEGRTPRHLDDMLNEIFGNRLYRPEGLKGRFGSAREGAANNRWPTRRDLRGRIIVVLTGGKLLAHNQTQHEYIDQRGYAANMFVAVDLDDANDYTGVPEHFTNTTAGHLVFYNLKQDNFNQVWINGIRSRNYLTRMWWSGGSDNGRELCNLLNDEVTHPAFYTQWQNNGHIVVDLNDQRNICRRR